jgi:hypothetical protein
MLVVAETTVSVYADALIVEECGGDLSVGSLALMCRYFTVLDLTVNLIKGLVQHL